MDDGKARGVERVLYVDGEDGFVLIICQCVGSRDDFGTIAYAASELEWLHRR